MSSTNEDHKSTERMRSSHWADHRDRITFLYQTQGRELKDVQKLMREQHNFDASESMYKKKIRQWHLQRNLRAEEKEYIIGQIAEREREGKSEHLILWRGQPVDMAIITRYRRDMARKSGSHQSNDLRRSTTNQADIQILTPPLPSSASMDGIALARSLSQSSWTSDILSPATSSETESSRESPPRPQQRSRLVVGIPATLDAQAVSPSSSNPMDYHDLVTVLDYCSIADRLVSMNQFAAGRALVKVAGNLLFKMSLLSDSRQHSSAITYLPISLGTLFLFQKAQQQGWSATDSFFRHAVPLLTAHFDPANPMIKLLEGFYELEDKAAAYAHLVHFVLRNSDGIHGTGVDPLSTRVWRQNKQRSLSPGKVNNPDTSLCPTRMEHLIMALEANEEMLGTFHRQTLSHLSNLAWLNLVQSFQHNDSDGARRASEYFATLYARIQTTGTVDESGVSISHTAEETVFISETFRGAILAAVAQEDWGFVHLLAEQGIKFIGKQCDSIESEYRNNILEFLLSHSNSITKKDSL